MVFSTSRAVPSPWVFGWGTLGNWVSQPWAASDDYTGARGARGRDVRTSEDMEGEENEGNGIFDISQVD